MTNEKFIKSISLDGEEWKDVVGFEGIYMISNFGRAASLPRIIKYCSGNHRPVEGKLLNPWNSSCKNEDGNTYKTLSLSSGGKVSKKDIHRLVALYFVENPHQYEFVDHIDGNPSNNHYSNLRWCDQTINMNNPVSKERARKNQNHPKNHSSTSKAIVRISPNGETKTYPSINEAVRDGYTKSRISCCCNGHTDSYKGFSWKFI